MSPPGPRLSSFVRSHSAQLALAEKASFCENLRWAFACSSKDVTPRGIFSSLQDSGEKLTEKGNKVRFRLDDVFLPNVIELRTIFPEEELVEGTVIDFSDSGSRHNAFAVIEVILKRTVIILVERLEPVSNSVS